MVRQVFNHTIKPEELTSTKALASWYWHDKQYHIINKALERLKRLKSFI